MAFTTTSGMTPDARAAGVTTRRRFLTTGLATGLLALGLLGGARPADADVDAATAGLERAGSRVGSSPGSRDSTVAGARAAPAVVGLERAGTRTASSSGSRVSTLADPEPEPETVIVGTEQAGVRVGTAPGSRESTIDGAHAGAVGAIQAGTRVGSAPGSRDST